ncbi:sphingomyelin phosphodiesterase [Thalassomonas actiniarum]|uniref:Sphingomyelin phosphodiesterase n=1 Tax=Thalassomonas actiniarum TaxID=485447 RepID=A0AAE9YUL9_9GAMM|nr:sphingomyelin phosphodiesterase [Thalassomonas actiniarum]WDE00724.1 sphingomyelin phosphodiesterase [Thalassomonas actiniarum]
MTFSVKTLTALCLGASLALPVLADSDVYVTNNSPQNLSVSVSHTGDALLIEGSEWQQHVQTLGPWETRMVLSFNRWENVKSGKTYHFETMLTNEHGDSVALHQQVKGHWYNSSLKHGASSDEFALRWYDDRDIHREQVQMSQQGATTELAFKAAATARYDDLYYAVTPQKIDEQANPDADTLKVMTYNIWALPAIASHIGDRYDILPAYMKGYDVLMLQEVFASGREAFLRTLAAEYPYQTRMLDKDGINIYDGGVTIVSRYPIVNQGQYVYPDCSGSDCFADKGLNYAEVIKGGKAYHLLATHTASFDTDTAREYRQRQFQQMRTFAENLNIPADETVIYGGDFNVNKRKFADDYADMLANLNAQEPEYGGYTESTFDPRINGFAGKALSGGENIEYLDYIVVSKAHQGREHNTNVVKIPRSSDQRLFKHWNLSDHFPVVTELR